MFFQKLRVWNAFALCGIGQVSVERRESGISNLQLGLTYYCSSLSSFVSFRPGMVARVAEKAASLGLSIENMTTTLRIGKDGTREFVIDAMVSSPNMADYDNLDSMIHDMSSLKTDLELSHFDVFVHAGKHK